MNRLFNSTEELNCLMSSEAADVIWRPLLYIYGQKGFSIRYDI